MKFFFEIATTPMLHMIVTIAIVISSLTSLAAIAVAISHPTISYILCNYSFAHYSDHCPISGRQRHVGNTNSNNLGNGFDG
jgi:hypothetical protein